MEYLYIFHIIVPWTRGGWWWCVEMLVAGMLRLRWPGRPGGGVTLCAPRFFRAYLIYNLKAARRVMCHVITQATGRGRPVPDPFPESRAPATSLAGALRSSAASPSSSSSYFSKRWIDRNAKALKAMRQRTRVRIAFALRSMRAQGVASGSSSARA